MSVGPKEVEGIAVLARLALAEGEVDTLAGELSAILDHIAALQGVNTDGIEPMTHAVPMDLRLRDDEVEESLSVEAAVGRAPGHAGDFFQVPNIIKPGTQG